MFHVVDLNKIVDVDLDCNHSSLPPLNCRPLPIVNNSVACTMHFSFVCFYVFLYCFARFFGQFIFSLMFLSRFPLHHRFTLLQGFCSHRFVQLCVEKYNKTAEHQRDIRASRWRRHRNKRTTTKIKEKCRMHIAIKSFAFLCEFIAALLLLTYCCCACLN